MARDVERRMEEEAEARSMNKVPMKRLREDSEEEERTLYQVAAGLFRGEAPRAAPRGLEAGEVV